MATASNNKAANARVIDYAFKRLLLNERNVAEKGMVAIAEEALSYVANAHEIYDAADASTWGNPHHGEHIEMHIQGSNTMAVAVGHDNHVVYSKAYEGGFSDEGHAEELARQYAQSNSAGCWVAVIVSDMEGSIKFPYNESKEERYFDYAKKMVGYYAIHNFRPIR